MALAAAVTIRITGSELVSGDTLIRAERVASSIFAQAGIRVTWVSCQTGRPSNPCGPPEGRAGLSLQILPKALSNVSADGMGFAVIPSTEAEFPGYAAVSYPQIVAVAEQCDQSTPVVLGTAIAHEVGHLLLGLKAHSGGVMSSRLNCQALGLASRAELWFGPGEARRMRAARALRR